jgi:ATP-dependent helicase/nuclease subunit A
MYKLIEEGLNPDQKKAVEQLKNCVVSAGAGSGKTFVLAKRYAHLVVDKDISVENILTLTFTKKATSEMYQRIYQTLADIANDAEEGSVEKQRAQVAVANFQKSRIQTIDSFCSTIVKKASRFYGIRPDFITDDSKVADEARSKALPFVLTHRKNEALQQLLKNGNLESIAEDLFVGSYIYHSNIAEPLDFYAFLKIQVLEIEENWVSVVSSVIENVNVILDRCKKNKLTILSTPPEKNQLHVYFTDCKNSNEQGQAISSFSQQFVQNITTWIKEVYAVSKTKAPRKDSKAEQDPETCYGQNIVDLRDLYDKLSAMVTYIFNFPAMLTLFPLIAEFHAKCDKNKRATGILTFSDISSLALKILIEHPEIRFTEKIVTNKIMIDEFQDNNEKQRDMLFLIAENENRMEKSIPPAFELCSEKLFFVGDEKQSIYKFRGADVSVFRQLTKDLNGDQIYLKTNYRSHPALIAGFNTLFGGYDYPSKDEELDTKTHQGIYSVFLQKQQLKGGVEIPFFEAEYKAVEANFYAKEDEKHEHKIEYSEDPRIHICLYDSTSLSDDELAQIKDDRNVPLSKDETLAVFTAQKINELLSLNGNKTEESYKTSDFAILFRSYTKQFLYEKHLRRLKIPYVSESITGFFGDAPVNDIYTILRLIVYPQDAAAYGAVLRSPFVRLSSAGLTNCLLAITEHNQDDISTEKVLFVSQNGATLCGIDKIRYQTGLEKYNDLCEKAKTLSCAELLSVLWYNEGYRFECSWNINVALFSELYDFLFEIARTIDLDGGGLTQFVENLSQMKKSGERLKDMDIPLERESAVHLISIHKSKGLEFPVVFICGVSDGGGRDTNNTVAFFNNKTGMSLNFPVPSVIPMGKKNWFYTSMSQIETQKSEAELRRLLYVAATRAEKELYITADYSLSKDETAETLSDALSLLSEKNAERADIVNKDKKYLTEAQFGIPNNTMFSFMIPLLSHTCNKQNTPFTFEKISTVTRRGLQNPSSKIKLSSIQEVQQKAVSIFENAQIITTPSIPNIYRSPSHLIEESQMKFDFENNIGAQASFSLYPEIDVLVNSIKDFEYTDFGTIAHAYVEAAFTGKPVKISPNVTSLLDQKQLSIVKNISTKMMNEFFKSNLGIAAKHAEWAESEYFFKMLITGQGTPQKIIVNGSIDLIFEEKQIIKDNLENSIKLVVVDFKTDQVENPQMHYLQLATYRRAAAKMRNIDPRDTECWLYYLRTGHAVNISKECAEIDIEKVVFEQ